jgi:hypothetical protein
MLQRTTSSGFDNWAEASIDLLSVFHTGSFVWLL